MQRIKVDLEGRSYTYLWEGESPLEAGEWVVLPPNRLHPREFSARVVKTDSDYEGPLASVVCRAQDLI